MDPGRSDLTRPRWPFFSRIESTETESHARRSLDPVRPSDRDRLTRPSASPGRAHHEAIRQVPGLRRHVSLTDFPRRRLHRHRDASAGGRRGLPGFPSPRRISADVRPGGGGLGTAQDHDRRAPQGHGTTLPLPRRERPRTGPEAARRAGEERRRAVRGRPRAGRRQHRSHGGASTRRTERRGERGGAARQNRQPARGAARVHGRRRGASGPAARSPAASGRRARLQSTLGFAAAGDSRRVTGRVVVVPAGRRGRRTEYPFGGGAGVALRAWIRLPRTVCGLA